MKLVKLNKITFSVLTAISSTWAFAATSQSPDAAPPFLQPAISAPFIDMGATVTPSIDTIGVQNGLSQMTLAFLTSDAWKKGQCIPVWAGQDTEGMTSSISTFIRQSIDAYKAKGGDVLISIGGANGSLAPDCSTEGELQNALQTIVDTYNVTHLDFDIEGSADVMQPNDPQHIDMRSQAIAAMQQAAIDGNKTPIDITLTLPINPDGLDANGLSVLNSALKNGVRLSRVNGMAMDYGSTYDSSDMAKDAETAAQALAHQIQTAYHDAGLEITLHNAAIMVGITPMIGINDNGTDFTLDNANTVVAFANKYDLGELSFWQIGRDLGNCGAESGYCSGIQQSNYQFTSIFAPYGGSITPGVKGVTKDASYVSPVPPLNNGGGGGCSNIPVSKEGQPWDPTLVYQGPSPAHPIADTVSYKGGIYTAAYWTCGDQPDQSEAWTPPAPPPGQALPWNTKTVYSVPPPPASPPLVTDGGYTWQANWWNQNDKPGTDGAWTNTTPPTGPQPWSKTTAYPATPTPAKVIYDNATWTNHWYSNAGDIPGVSQAGEWTIVTQ